MNRLNLHVGYIPCEKTQTGEILKSFEFDLTQFPSLFINNGNIKYLKENDPLTVRWIRDIIKLDEKTKNLKTVIIDNNVVTYCSVFWPGEYKKNAPDIMLKRLNTIIGKIRERYLQQGDEFFPYTKYVIVVKGIRGLEQYILNIMSKLGPIGVYLIFADEDALIKDYPELTTYLYGQITYVPAFISPRAGLYRSQYLFTLERFLPKYDRIPEIFTDASYNLTKEPYPEPFREYNIDTLFG